MGWFGHRRLTGTLALGCAALTLASAATACSVKKTPTTTTAKVDGSSGTSEQGRDAGGFSAPGGVKPGTQANKDGVVPPDSVVGNGGAAPDRGVGAKDITIGAIILREDTFAAFGATYKGKRTEDVAQPFIDDVNQHGGINGRKLALKITRFSPLVPSDTQVACVQQAEDFQVFATLASAGFGSDGELCLAAKQTPLLTSNLSSADNLYNRDLGWVRQTVMNKDRTAKNWVDWIVQSGTATPATKIGVLHSDTPEDNALTDGVLVPYMKSKGLNVVAEAGFSGTSVDTVTSEAQTTVLSFKTKGVDLIVPNLDFLRTAAFLGQADTAKYKPKYTVSDLGLLDTDATTSFYPASQWAGTTGVTAYVTGANDVGKEPATPTYEQCRSIYEAHGQHFGSNAQAPQFPDATEIVSMMYFCEHIALFAQAARAAGQDLTRAKFLNAVSQLDTWTDRVTLTQPLSFGPKKYDGADQFAVVRWQADCYGPKTLGCFRQVEGFRKGSW